MCIRDRTAHIPASQSEYVMLAVRIYHGKSELVMIISAGIGRCAEIGEEILCPASAPFIVKSKMVILHTVRKLGPKTVLLGLSLIHI